MKTPVRNSILSVIFSRVVSFNRQTTDNGRMRMKKSPVMFPAQLKVYRTTSFGHFKFGSTMWFQESIGLQRNTMAKNVAREMQVRYMPSRYSAMRYFLLEPLESVR